MAGRHRRKWTSLKSNGRGKNRRAAQRTHEIIGPNCPHTEEIMKLTSRIAAAACGVIAATVGSVALADYPEKPIEVIIPYGPGSNSDATGRLFVNAMAEVMNGARLVPLNVDGAGGTIGTAQLAAARNDGYSIGFNP